MALLDRLHAAQNEFYAGGSSEALEELLAADVTWTTSSTAASRGAGCSRSTARCPARLRSPRR
jgi:hypothetical protein